MYKKITLVLGALCLGFFANAQNENDALLLGRTYQFGTARNLSLSGATGSLGADFGAINNNPAGIGLYRKSEFTFTPNVSVSNTDGEYQGTSTSQSRSRFNFNQAGVVFANAKKGKAYKRSKWKTSNFSIGFNRLANFNSNYAYRGSDNTSSFIENFSEEFNNSGGYTDGALDVVSEAAYGAYQTYLIDADPGDSTRAASFVPFAGGLERSKTMRRTGGINELSFSYGANYNEKVMIGFTVGLPIVNITQEEILTEDDISGNTNNDFDYVDLYQNVNIEGSGINLKLGTIFKANKYLRLGLALHTPTRYSLTDISYIEIESHTENYLPREQGINDPVSTYKQSQDESNLFEYRYISPMKAIFSGTGLFGNKGFISADVEWINYNGMKYRYDNSFSGAEQIVNNAIQNTYKDAVNVRIGGEARLDQIALRAGYSYYGNPYEDYNDGASQTASLGLGYRGKGFFLDVAAQIAFAKDIDMTHTLARTSAIPTAEITRRNTQISMTAGFRF